MVVILKEGADDITKVFTSEIIREDSNSIDILKATILPNVDINTGDEVTYYDKDNNLLFTGLVWSINNETLKSIVVYDSSAQLINRLVNNVYRNQSPEFIIEDIIGTYSDLIFNSTVSTGVLISKVVFKEKSALDCIKKMLALFNGNIRTDQNKNIYLETRQENSSTVSITEGIEKNLSGWNTDTDNLATKITLIGAKILSKTEETFTGTFSEVTLIRQPINVRVTVSGSELTQEIDGQISGDFTVDIQDKKIKFNTAYTDIIVNYSYESQIKVTATASSDLVDKYGIVEKKIEKKYIESMSEARSFVRNYLDIFADGIESATFQTNTLDLSLYNTNYNIRVSDSVRTPAIDDDYIIKKVVRKFPGTVEVVVGEDVNSYINWQKETVDRISQLEEQNNNSDFVQLYEFINNNVRVNIQTEITKIEERTYFGDTFYLEEDGFGTRNQMLDDGSGPIMRELGYVAGVITTANFVTESGDNLITESGDNLIITLLESEL